MGNDLEIEINPASVPGTYEVQVDSPAGSATGTMRLDAEQILGRRRELAASVLASAVTSRSSFETLERPVREVGHTLFESLFAGRVYGRYTASLQEASRRGEPLRVVLRLRAPGLSGLPWEALFDPESGEYLCQREPLVRYVEAAQPSAPLSATGPLRILGMVAAPRDLPTLDTAEERRRLDDALGELADQGLVEMSWVEPGTWGALQTRLMSGPWHVLHVVGHGGVSPQGGVLALEHETTHNAVEVSATRFARLLHACRPVPRLVVLNSCSSGESAADDVLSSTAAALVHSGISAAVAMQFAVTDPAALAFARGFYQALAHNIAVDEAVRLGRIAIDGTSEQTLEWVTPVVYLRTEDTRLFDLSSRDTKSSPRRAPETPPPEEEISREAAKYGLYVQALAAARNDEYDEAVALLDSVITLDPTYRDATQRREAVRRTQHLVAEYAAARAAEEAGEWEAARRGFAAVVELDRDYRDALARHDECQRRVSISSLQDELRVHAAADDWAAVLAVSDELAWLDPQAADPDGLASTAREVLAREQEEQQREVEPEVEAGAELGRTEVLPVVPVEETGTGEETGTREETGTGEETGTREETGTGEETGADEEAGGAGPEGPVVPRWRQGHRWWWWVGGAAAVLVAATAAGLVVLGGEGDGGGVRCWDGSRAGSAVGCPPAGGGAGPRLGVSLHGRDLPARCGGAGARHGRAVRLRLRRLRGSLHALAQGEQPVRLPRRDERDERVPVVPPRGVRRAHLDEGGHRPRLPPALQVGGDVQGAALHGQRRRYHRLRP